MFSLYKINNQFYMQICIIIPKHKKKYDIILNTSPMLALQWFSLQDCDMHKYMFLSRCSKASSFYAVSFLYEILAFL